MKKGLMTGTLMLVLIVTMFAVNAPAADDNVFKINIPQEPSILDPAHFRDDNATSIIYAIHEPLFRVAKDSRDWEPGLATDFTVSDDRLVYTIHLRKDAVWEDGTPITAEDVVYSLRRGVDPKVASEKAFDYYDIKNGEAVNKGELPLEEYGVKAIDDATIEITLERPIDFFIDLLKRPGFAPVQKAAGERLKDLYGTDVGKVVASGPFKLKSWEHDATIVLEKNDAYWDAQNVSLDGVLITLAKDANAITGLYKTGELDFMIVDTDFLPEFKDSPEFHSIPLVRVSFIEFNPNKEFLNNIKIREALSIAFNRKIYVENVLANGALPAYGMIPPGIKGKDGGDFREQAGNLVTDMALDPSAAERARKLLEEGLQELGKTREDMAQGLEMYCVDRPSSKKLAQAIQHMWRKTLNVEIKVVPMQVKMLIPLLMNGGFQMVVGGGRTGVTTDPSYFIDFIYYEGKWDDPVYTDFITKSFETTGDERIDYLMKAEKYVLDQFVFIPQNFPVANYVLKENIEGFRRPVIGIQYDFKYIQKK